MPDLGEALVETIFRKLQVDEEWATRAERGFSWIAQRLEQRVWASKPIEYDGYTIFRLCAETVVVDSVWLALRNILANKVRSAKEWRAAMNQFAVMYGERFTGTKV